MVQMIGDILFYTFIGLIIADIITGRKNNQTVTLLTIFIVVLLPFMGFCLSFERRGVGYLILFVILEWYLNIRLMTSKYLFLCEPATKEMQLKGGKSLFSYAIIYNFGMLAIFFIGHIVLVIVDSRRLFGDLLELPELALQIQSGLYFAHLESLENFLLFFIFSPVLKVYLQMQILLFLIVPIVMAFRGFKAVAGKLGMSRGKTSCYMVSLALPYLNSIPLILLRRKCLRYGRESKLTEST